MSKGGLFDGHPQQVLTQIEGVAIVIVFDVIVSLVILKLIDWTIGLRVSEEVEVEGLDIGLHGEVVP
jgi:Amt family ammonium transporter